MTTDASHTPSDDRSASGGTGLLLIVSGATILTVAAEAAFIRWATWALLPLIVAAIVVMAIGVVTAVGRLIGEGEPAAAPERAAAGEADHVPAPAVPAGAGRVILR